VAGLGQPLRFSRSALVTYEAFAPLISSLLAQYAKMVHARPSCGRPPLLVLLSSLGWANSPTHQNTDLAATVLARPSPRMYLLCPLGARSAAWRTERLLEEARDAVAVVVCSKQRLLDLADPGGAAVEIRVTGAGSAVATVVAIGDVCVTEAVGAMITAAQAGVALRVVAAVDLRGLEPGVWGDGGLGSLEGPTLALAWCAPGHVASWLWRLAGRVFPVLGYGERWGATAWETLRLNRMDRISVLQELAALGVDLPFEQTSSLACDLEQVCREQQPEGVPEFDAPSLSVSSLPVRQRGAPPLRARM
jgi:xylulose-5-phosphate/fructose-6-phosphate phosphoketolase